MLAAPWELPASRTPGQRRSHYRGCWSVITANARAISLAVTSSSGLAGLLDSLRRAGAHEQAAALAARAAAHAPLDNPDRVADLLDSLREAGADEQAAALLARDPAAHVALDDLYGVAKLLDSLRRAGAHEQAAALAARAAAHAPLDNPVTVAFLLDSLRRAGAHEQAAALAGRAAAHVALDDPYRVAFLLGSLPRAGAHEQAAALAARAAAHAPLDNPAAVADLLGSLRQAGAHEQAAILTARLPAGGMFELFLAQNGLVDQFRFGREADGTPAASWDWKDLDLCLAPGRGTGATGAAWSMGTHVEIGQLDDVARRPGVRLGELSAVNHRNRNLNPDTPSPGRPDQPCRLRDDGQLPRNLQLDRTVCRPSLSLWNDTETRVAAPSG